MDQHVLSIEVRSLTRAVDRYLGESMPESARVATGGNAHIIAFLDRNRDKEIYQHTIEQKFCITRSTASRVLTLMEKKGLIVREPVPHDARLKRIVLTDKAEAIVSDLKANADRVERMLVNGLTPLEQETMRTCIERMRENIREAQRNYDQHMAGQPSPSEATNEEEALRPYRQTKEESK
ncbi:MarR family winged helix-turn-helix transcriptional regulator [Bifidobacterium jacchi]|uniref:MarR family transcriptional regulator n=1 Tax=Bifidobacterium jacchi TaxID=2490545 RepID=A0A5N5RNB6_9BIFI|nr:MarR family transcriptional regulator [Bifidobacterium jacchi]